MIKFDAEIISNKSIANIKLNDFIDKYESQINSHHIRIDRYFLPNSEEKLVYSIDNVLKVVILTNGKIISISCNENYKGKYKNLLYTGQTFVEIVKLTKRQRIFNGCIVINDDFGFSFELPSPYDEIADKIEDIPSELKLNSIVIGDFSSWQPRKN